MGRTTANHHFLRQRLRHMSKTDQQMEWLSRRCFVHAAAIGHCGVVLLAGRRGPFQHMAAQRGLLGGPDLFPWWSHSFSGAIERRSCNLRRPRSGREVWLC